MGSRVIRRTSRRASRDATNARLDAVAPETARRAQARVVRGGDGTRASSLPGPRSTGAHTLGVENTVRDLDGPGGFVVVLPPKKTTISSSARRTRT
jgi:hypothetical protein